MIRGERGRRVLRRTVALLVLLTAPGVLVGSAVVQAVLRADGAAVTTRLNAMVPWLLLVGGTVAWAVRQPDDDNPAPAELLSELSRGDKAVVKKAVDETGRHGRPLPPRLRPVARGYAVARLAELAGRSRSLRVLFPVVLVLVLAAPAAAVDLWTVLSICLGDLLVLAWRRWRHGPVASVSGPP